MKPLLFVRADDAETFGIAPTAVAGVDIHVWDALARKEPPDLRDVAGVVMFGSSFNVEHADEQPFIHAMRSATLDAIDAGVPFLGLCFGAQVLAWSLGATVRKAPVREIGYVPLRPLPPVRNDPVLGHYTAGDLGFQWHMDTFDLPAEAELLIGGEAVPHQAYRVGNAAWATQFHLEIDEQEIELWIDDVADTLERDWGVTPEALREQTVKYQRRHEEQGRETFRRFVKVAQERQRT